MILGQHDVERDTRSRERITIAGFCGIAAPVHLNPVTHLEMGHIPEHPDEDTCPRFRAGITGNEITGAVVQ